MLEGQLDIGERLLRGVRDMEESVTYQAIVLKGFERGVREGVNLGRQEGRIEGELSAILRIGTRRLGQPSVETIAKLEAITELEQLNTLLDRIVGVDSWEAPLTED